MKRIFLIIGTLLAIFVGKNLYAQPSWNTWLRELKTEAVGQGIHPDFFDDVFRDVRPNKRVVNFDRRQPERRLTFLKYRSTRADNYRIKLGKREYKKHYQVLNEVGNRFNVDPCFIIALWGLESSYGRYMGNFPVIKSLATLAYDTRRPKFFRKELLHALHILQDGHVTPKYFKGEWAGGSGHPQFLPSSWYRYAVDYNQDGRKDIWTTLVDAFASIANYLSSNGWHRGEPWAMPVVASGNIPDDLYGYKTKKTVGEWKAMGVRPESGYRLPGDSMRAYLVRPHGGPTFLAFHNFRVIMTYNSSTFYAGTVGYMADKICSRPVYAQSRIR